MSLFSTMNVASKGLHASQIAMGVAGQNITNADVKGYSRKRVNLAADYQRSERFGQMGFGVQVLNITRLRNEYIDSQIRRQSHELGKNVAVDYALESMENILLEPSDTGILEYINKFFDSWENLANNPADLAARTMMQTNTNMLTSAFHNAALELETLKNTRNQEMVSLVHKINTIASDIFNLNSEISIVELSGNSANDSKDRRDQLMRDLSELIDFDSFTAPDGQVTITVDGNILVSPVSVNTLEVYEDRTTRSDDNSGYHQYGIRMSKGRNPVNPKGGQIKGVMIARDEMIPKYEKQLNELAKALITKVNDIHKRGYNIRGFTGFDFFDPTCLDAKTIKLSASIATDVGNIAASRGGSFQHCYSPTLPDNKGLIIPAGTHDYGVAAMQLSKTKGEIWDELLGDPSSDRATNIKHGSVTVMIQGGPQDGLFLLEGTDYHIDYNTGTIQMLNGIFDAENLIVDFEYSAGSFPGTGNNENAILLGQLRTQLTMNESALGDPSSTFDQYYSSMIADLGLDRTKTLADIRTREYLIEEYDTQQDSVAGVSLDEEMADLIKYQYTYQAAARIFTTVQAMLDVLLNI